MTQTLARATVALLFVIALLLAVVAGRGALPYPPVNVTVQQPEVCSYAPPVNCAPNAPWVGQ